MQIFAGQVRFGVAAGQQDTTFPDYLRIWQEAERLGYDWASVFDHFLPIVGRPIEGSCYEGLTLLSAMAAHTSRIRCGQLVLGNTYRNPALLAKMACTIDHISNGRFELGIGAAWNQTEHDQYGFPFPTPATRIRMLGEAMKILRGMFTQERTTFEGRYYSIKDALCEPKPLQEHLPIWIGGGGEQLTMRVVAESADGWNVFRMPHEAYQHKLDVLAEHCRDVGRDPEDIRKSLGFPLRVRETEAELQELQAASPKGGLQPVYCTPEQAIESMLPYVRMGVGDIIVMGDPPTDYPTLQLVAEKVMPAVKSEGAAILAARA